MRGEGEGRIRGERKKKIAGKRQLNGGKKVMGELNPLLACINL